MKWPNSLTIVRHGQSAFNLTKEKKLQNPSYQQFLKLWEKEFSTAQTLDWPSDELKKAAKQMMPIARVGYSDYQTPLTELGRKQAIQTGSALSKKIALPDIEYVSPYLRTQQTWECMKQGWKELNDCRAIFEERVREGEHGLAGVYNDPKIYNVFHPEQGLLFKQEGEYHYRFLNGESKSDVRDRVRSFISTVIREHAGENVLVVSHHITLLCTRANLERWTPEQFLHVDKNEKPINCGVTIYQGNPRDGKNGKLALQQYNEKLY